MKLSISLDLILQLRWAMAIALGPTLRAIWHKPSLLFHSREISRLFMSHIWSSGLGDGIDENARDVKGPLITPNAYGVVLDIGAGHGHTANYLDINRVTKYVALEPNTHMHEEIRKIANKAGWTEEAGTLLILPYGAENTSVISSALGGPLSVDTVVCVLSLCTVPSPEETINRMSNELLKPGGVFLLYEHVLSPCADVAWWQWFWSPIWSKAFDGCRLDRPTYVWVRKATNWEVDEVWTQEGEPVEHLFWHQVGKFVKAT
ncbi:hypothetical protein CERSUDRAFT_85003 [Gelatoporia subvermispora B]|uniref:Methyltransferase type 11 domain-containing protein n=1 Tax=Ceriporiopsis subvermispora (strain B) TaxID=914234 RepID=M2RAX4_CERS8|nr:hypothetical protein CERSUDRAFT_85003 [Gelatoporia subvermispora B]